VCGCAAADGHADQVPLHGHGHHPLLEPAAPQEAHQGGADERVHQGAGEGLGRQPLHPHLRHPAAHGGCLLVLQQPGQGTG